jgi:hypothetical protein
MEKFAKSENNNQEAVENVTDTTELNTEVVGENIDLKGGRVLNVPDFVDLAEMGFSEDELIRILKLRRRFEQGDHEATPEVIRLRFARFLFERGKIAA